MNSAYVPHHLNTFVALYSSQSGIACIASWVIGSGSVAERASFQMINTSDLNYTFLLETLQRINQIEYTTRQQVPFALRTPVRCVKW